jgi:small GTP-binding protein
MGALNDKHGDKERGLPATAGVSFRYLQSLQPMGEALFQETCEIIKAKTMEKKCSLVELLWNDPNTRKFVKKVADVFVSYAWKGSFAGTMGAIETTLMPGEDVFVWMDVACVNQHLASLGEMSFKEWARIFENNLKRIGRALIVMLPVLSPISATRSWCCFEWYVITAAKIRFRYCVNPTDERTFCEQVLQRWVDENQFRCIFAGINVASATACSLADQSAIYDLLVEVGLVKVNNILMLSLKKHLSAMLDMADKRAKTPTEKLRVLITRAEPYSALNLVDFWDSSYQKAIQFMEKHDLSGPEKVIVLKGVARSHLAPQKKIEEKLSSALMVAKTHYGTEEHPNVAEVLFHLTMSSNQTSKEKEDNLNKVLEIQRKTLGNNTFEVGRTLDVLATIKNREGEIYEALRLYGEAMEVRKIALGLNHPDYAFTLSNMAGILQQTREWDRAIAYYREALDIFKRTLGENDETVAIVWGNIAWWHEEQLQFNLAIKANLEAMRIRKLTLRWNHPKVNEIRIDILNIRKKMRSDFNTPPGPAPPKPIPTETQISSIDLESKAAKIQKQREEDELLLAEIERSQPPIIRTKRIVILGIENSGKTVMLYQCKLHRTVTTIPTIGFNVENIHYGDCQFTMWDIGGQPTLRPLWRHYLENTEALLYVVDSSTDEEKLKESYLELQKTLLDPNLQSATCLVVANKQDLPEARKADQIKSIFSHSRIAQIFEGECLTGKGLQNILDYLLQS